MSTAENSPPVSTVVTFVVCCLCSAAEPQPVWQQLAPFFKPPPEYAGQFGAYKSPLIFEDGRPVKSASEWPARRQEILQYWQKVLGPWPPLLERPQITFLEKKERENFIQHRVRLEIAPHQTGEAYLL